MAAQFVNWEWAEVAISEIRKSENCSAITFQVQVIGQEQGCSSHPA